MADTEIEIPGVGRVAFPDSMTSAQIDAAATRLYKNADVTAKAKTTQTQQSSAASEKTAPGSSVGLGMAAAGAAVPAAATAAMEVATNPAVPQTLATIGRVAGAVAPVVKYGPVGAVGSAKGAWAGGKAGWFTGKLAQQAAAPVAAAAEAAAPYAQALSTLSGAQGALDLAQMAEPDRRDLGVLGVGPTVKAGAIPDTPKLVSMPVEDAVKSLTDAGWPEARAKSYVTQMRKLMAKR